MAEVATHPAVTAEARARASVALEQLESRNLLSEVCEELQSELVAQWLKETDLERRERCWHECRAIEAVRVRLIAHIGVSLSEGLDVPEADALGDRLRELENPMWASPWRRWVLAVSRWRDGR